MAMYFLGQNRQAPTVNYPQGDYRTISRLDRSRAETAKNSQLEAELARKRAWEDELFQRKLAELQKNIWAGGPGGGVGGGLGAGAQFAPQAGGQAGGVPTSMERMMQQNPEMALYLGQMAALNRMPIAAGGPLAKGYARNWWFGKGLGSYAPAPPLPGRRD